MPENHMAKIDLHVHSLYSEHPSEWFLQRLGAKESYTDPEWVYQLAKKRQMDYVTLTDHNRIQGALLLKEKHPDDSFISAECTTYFPEDGCKIHILIYGIDESHFGDIQDIRRNIYELRDYIKANDIAHSVAHATFRINKKLTLEHVEKLILLFDVFEGINGGRNYQSNHQTMELLKSLTADHTASLQDRYEIEPFSDTPWIKAFTAGSDDHGGLFVGQTYTLAQAETLDGILEDIRRKRTSPMGRHNDYMSLAFTVYKIAFDFSKSKSSSKSATLPGRITENIFASAPFGVKNKLKYQRLRSLAKKNGNRIGRLFVQLLDEVKKINPLEMDARLGLVYDTASDIADEFFRDILKSLENDLTGGDVINLVRNISSSIPGLFLSLPFFSALKHMFQSRELLKQLRSDLNLEDEQKHNRILWFTDTINDRNLISETLKEIGWISFRNGNHIRFVTAAANDETHTDLPPNILYLPLFHQIQLPENSSMRMCFPSVLRSLKTIHNEDPTEIYISTPGPVGLFGLLCAKLLNVRATGVYHTGLNHEVEKVFNDASLKELVEVGIRRFYSEMDVIKVNAKASIAILEDFGLDRAKMELFPLAIDPNTFVFHKDGRSKLSQRISLKPGINLLYADHLSVDINLEFLVRIYRTLKKNRAREDLNLIIVGSGPSFDEMRVKTQDLDRIHFLGQLSRKEMPKVYSSADLFLYPGNQTVNGTEVLEAQACQLPAVVSNREGPGMLVLDGITGREARSDDLEDWISKVEDLMDLRENDLTRFEDMKKAARSHVLENYSWIKLLGNILHSSDRTPGQ
jgi:glycosyltransferase involved in cell wall biosynthesis/predicted metal-dependent phosphoesterase TrpH